MIEKLNKFFNAYAEKLFLVFLVFMVLPFVVLCFYAVPNADDLWFGFNYQNYGFIGSFKVWYLSWFGRFSFVLIMNLYNALGAGNMMYCFFCLALLCVFYFSLYRFIKVAFEIKQCVKNHIYTLIFCLIFIYKMPVISEGFFWLSGSVIYVFPASLIILFFSFLISFSLFTAKKRKLFYFLLCVLAFFIVGLSEVAMLFMNLSLIFIQLIKLFYNKKLSKSLLFIWMVVIISSLIVYLAPGNHIRELSETQYYGKNIHDIFYTVKNAMIATVSYLLFEWLRDSLLLLCTVLFIPVAIYQIRNNTQWFRLCSINPFLTSVASVFCIFIMLAMGYWNIGGKLPDRAINFIFYIFIFLWIFNIQSIMNYFVKDLADFKISGTSTYYRLVTLMVVLIIVISLSGENNIKIAYTDILNGQAKTYAFEMKERHNKLADNKSDSCFVPELQYRPSSLFVTDLKKEAHTWPNDIYEKVYNKKLIKLYDKEQ
jgi:hypothetical protein